ncbi:hypothetical protein OIU78_001878 [Salix suchowensis]|nr:hypothetical protein OIU78_001878 [Salix suchowensis]
MEVIPRMMTRMAMRMAKMIMMMKKKVTMRMSLSKTVRMVAIQRMSPKPMVMMAAAMMKTTRKKVTTRKMKTMRMTKMMRMTKTMMRMTKMMMRKILPSHQLRGGNEAEIIILFFSYFVSCLLVWLGV